MITALRPSEYTAALIQGLQARADWVRGKRALELGPGSGTVLAAMGALGAASLCAVDIEPIAVEASTALLRGLGYSKEVDIRCGDLWAPVAGRRFDVIAANLPQFPMEPVHYGGRLPSWSSGGRDGRRLVDRFIGGLRQHLSPGGSAIITHNAFISFEKTCVALARNGLSSRVAATVLVSLPEDKLRLISPDILRAEEGRTIHCHGPYAFAEMHVVEIFDATSSD
jgi:methylase of polypeptide subunit release factors